MDAARRQLLTAIELWFMDGDPVSVHSLAYAADEILHRLLRNQGGSDLLFDSPMVKKEHRGEFVKLLKEHANFFKHAERDAKTDEAIEFRPARSILFIGVCITAIQRMGLPPNDAEDAFLFWLRLHLPEGFFTEVPKAHISVEDVSKMRAMAKQGFLEAFLEVKRAQRVKRIIT